MTITILRRLVWLGAIVLVFCYLWGLMVLLMLL